MVVEGEFEMSDRAGTIFLAGTAGPRILSFVSIDCGYLWICFSVLGAGEEEEPF